MGNPGCPEMLDRVAGLARMVDLAYLVTMVFPAHRAARARAASLDLKERQDLMANRGSLATQARMAHQAWQDLQANLVRLAAMESQVFFFSNRWSV